MSETQHRIIDDDAHNISAALSPLYKLSEGVSDFTMDAWYWLVNYVQSAPERKMTVLATCALGVLLVLLLIKRTRFF